MPRKSEKYPPEERYKQMVELFADRSLHGKIINPATTDVCVWPVAERQRQIMACIWDALGYLDGINEDQNFHTKEFVKVLTALELMDMRLKQMWQPLQQTLEQVKKIQAAVNTMLSLTTVTIPGWMTKSEVLDGINRVAIDGGKSPTAAECGLIVDFVVDAQRHDVPGWIMSTAPPRGTVVLRVSKVTVVHQAEE